MSSHIEQRKNPTHQDPYTDTKTVTVTPEETQRSVSYQAPTPEMQEYIREHIIKPTAKAYGVNPDTGDVTPFQALGYNPEDERKRREAERALNDRKRKENAWYNAFAVLGDSLTAALGGNVWQRQPNNIGAKADADNARLIAEQKAEDEGNAAKLRAAGTAYANTVNQLIQNYLTKTTNTTTTGGSRKETAHHPEVSKTRQVAFPLGDADGSGSGTSGKGGKGNWKDNADYEIGLLHEGKLKYNKIKGSQAKNIVDHAETLYGKALEYGDDGTKNAILQLLGPNIVREDDAHPGKYIWDDEALLRSGYIFEADKGFSKGILKGMDKSIRDYYREITGDNTDYDQLPDWDMVTPAMQAINERRNTTPNTPPYRQAKNNSNDNIPPYKRK